MSKDSLCHLPAHQLRDAIREASISPVEAVEAVIERIERVNSIMYYGIYQSIEE